VAVWLIAYNEYFNNNTQPESPCLTCPEPNRFPNRANMTPVGRKTPHARKFSTPCTTCVEGRAAAATDPDAKLMDMT
jgi:hypothetical protein